MFFCLAGTQPVLPSPELLLQVWRSTVSFVKGYGNANLYTLISCLPMGMALGLFLGSTD